MSGATIVTDLQQQYWRQYLLYPGIWPGPWSSADSKIYQDPTANDGTVGGAVAAVMNAFAGNFEQINEDLVWAFLAARLDTSTGSNLDTFAAQFGLNQRGQGQSDDDYRTYISEFLLIPRVSRNAIQHVLELLTGGPVRMMEPWYLPDTMAWDNLSFWDVDDQNYPAQWGDPGSKYVGFVEMQLPPFSTNNVNPLYCWDAGFAWDAPSGYYLETESTWFTQQQQIAQAILDSKLFGTQIFYKIQPPQANYPVGSTLQLPEGTAGYALTLPAIKGPIVVVAQTSWMNQCYVINSQVNQAHIFFANSAPPGGGTLDYYVVNQDQPGVDYIKIPINPVSVATIGGTKTTGDVLSITVMDKNIPGGSLTVSYTVQSGDTLASITSNLALAVNSNGTLTSIGIQAANVSNDTFQLISTGQNTTLYAAKVIGTETLIIARTESIVIENDGGPNALMIPSPSWNATIWDGGLSNNKQTFDTSNLPPLGGNFGVITFPANQSAHQTVAAGTTAVTVALSQFPSLKAPFGVFALPSWNTEVGVIKGATQATFTFSNPPPVDSVLNWAVQNF